MAGFSKGLTSKDFISVVVNLHCLTLLHTLGLINHLLSYYHKQGTYANLQSSIERKYVCEEMKPFLHEHDQASEEEAGALCVGEDALYEEGRSTLCVGMVSHMYAQLPAGAQS